MPMPSQITARHYWLSDMFWQGYFSWIVGRHFRPMQILGDAQPPTDQAVLLLANHHSWWDGFLLYLLNTGHFNKRFHVMMLREELVKRPFLRTAGAFSIDRQNPRSMPSTWAHARELLSDPRNLVLVFPQGRIESTHVQAPTFMPGIKKLIEGAERPKFSISFCMTYFDYMAQSKPIPHLYLKHSALGPDSCLADVRHAFLSFYRESKAKQQAQYI